MGGTVTQQTFRLSGKSQRLYRWKGSEERYIKGVPGKIDSVAGTSFTSHYPAINFTTASGNKQQEV
jgi:hypothetical protein